MRRFVVAFMATISLALASGSVQAGNWEDFWARCKVDWHRNNAWPEPFNTVDRAAQREPFCIMVDNGWKANNTIGTFLFDADTQRLNQAGDLQVKWIVRQAPLHRRAVFVLRGETPEATAARIDSVQAVVAKYAVNGHMPPVLLTDSEPAGWPASYVDNMTQQFNATIPSPRLPAGGGEGEGGGGGGEGGN